MDEQAAEREWLRTHGQFLPEVPVVDEQEFDWEAEQERIEKCVMKLRLLKQRCVTKENRATVEEAIDLLLAYEDDLEGER